MNQMGIKDPAVIEKEVFFVCRDTIKAWWSDAFNHSQNLHPASSNNHKEAAGRQTVWEGEKSLDMIPAAHVHG